MDDSEARTETKNPGGRPRPPKPKLAFRVGIVGHRPDRLKEADLELLGQRIHQILFAIQADATSYAQDNHELYDTDSSLVMRAISPLAEGVDRIFASTALNLEWELACVFPFHQAEYGKDFEPEHALSPNSKDEFLGLLGKAGACFELDGSRDAESDAYAAAGEVVLNQSDLLIVVWDGDRQGKHGGTETTIDEARRKGVPTIWIAAKAPHHWHWIHPHCDPTGDSIGEVVREVLSVPVPSGQGNHKLTTERPREMLYRYFGETQPEKNIALLWKAFRSMVADNKLPKINWTVGDFETADVSDWPIHDPLGAQLRKFYVWPDKLADIYADRYRSSFLLVYFLAAFAVASALAPVSLNLLHWGKVAWTACEFSAIVVILYLVTRARNHQWHERWIDYRCFAELVRHLRVVSAVGGERVFPQTPGHQDSYGNPATSWMNWYVNAISRSVGLDRAVIDREYHLKILSLLESVLDGQIKYQELNRTRAERIEKRLQSGILVLLGFTLALCTVHLVYHHLNDYALIFWCGFLPAIGTALAAVNNQGEFRRLARRSESMHSHLSKHKKRVGALRDNLALSPEKSYARSVRRLAEDVSTSLVHEVLDWRVVFLDRPLEFEV